MSAAHLWPTALLLAFVLPLGALTLVGLRGTRALGVMVAPWTIAAGMFLLLAPNLQYEIPGVLLGMRIGIDDTGRSFLLIATLCWTASAFFARGYIAEQRNSFWAFFLVAYVGILGVVLSLDGITYLIFFALMSFSSYGLIIHTRSAEAVSAGRIFLSMVLVGEVLLFVGAVLWATGGLSFAEHAQQPLAVVPCLLLFLGFGIKVGVVPFHFWLPLAHPAAPTPASAVLSGALVKTGVLGWLRFLPLGTSELPLLGDLIAVAGLLGVFFGVALGWTQVKPKSILAYSTVSQVGLITATVGVVLQSPSSLTLALPAISFFVVHHGVAKTLLFLSVALKDQASEVKWLRTLYCIGVSWAAATLVGAPFTSGLLAKSAIKNALVSGGWEATLPWLLFASSVGTALLMMRFLVQVLRPAPPRAESAGASPKPSMWLPWGLLLVVSTCLPWLWPHALVVGEWASASVLKAVAATLIGAGAGLILMRGISAIARIPEGDIYMLLRLLTPRRSLLAPEAPADTAEIADSSRTRFGACLARVEFRLSSWACSIAIVLATVVLFVALALWG